MRSKGRSPKSMYGATVTSAQPATTSSVPLGRPYRRPPLKAIELASTMSAQTGKMWLSAPRLLANSTAALSPMTLASASRDTVML